ncbi:MAG: hypothetical protein EA345_18255 [Halomonas sp.]|nr:hypothetical protein [Halomonas sp.]TVP42710.1 MAG: hypothetical protein EA345_18255 [Halomonas sp.]
MQRSVVYAGVMVSLILAGCAGGQRTPQTASQETAEAPLDTGQPSVASQRASSSSVQLGSTAGVTPMERDWVPPLFTSPEEEASYYVSRLADRRFITNYGGSDNPRPWYIAAEKLGSIGLPAVPLLFARLNTSDDYEQMLVLYALQLATQDPMLMARTRGEYVQLGVVLDPAHNAENVVTAQQWWQKHASQVSY